MAAEPILSIDAFLSTLQHVKQVGDHWQAQCPAHEDQRASLSVSIGRSGRILVKCFAGCEFAAILSALHLAPRQLAPPAASTPAQTIPTIVAHYDYRAADGTLLYQVCRFQPKDFRQRRPNVAGGWIWNMQGVARVPYRLNDLRGHTTVYVPEGEKDCEALWGLGCPATCNVGGAGKWRDSDSAALKAIGVTRLAIIPDNDGPGRKHADDVAKSAKAAGIAVLPLALTDLQAKGDVSDWIAAGHGKADLDALMASKLWVVPKNTTLEQLEQVIDPQKDPRRWALSDLGAAESFVTREGDNIRYDTLQDRWLVWDGHVWKPDSDRAIYRTTHAHIRTWQQEAITLIKDKQERERLLDFLFKLERRSGIENLVAISRTLKPVADSGENWDKDPWLFGVPNGVIDLKTGKLFGGRREDRLTIQAATPYDPEAQCPRWRQFLDEVFEDNMELVSYIQRALGYSLSGDMREQCFFMCIGGGSNGKSTFTNALDAVWGKYAYTTDMKTFTTSQQTGEATFDIAELANRRLILASETKADSRLNEQALKNFTGGEKINAQRKYGHPFEFAPCGKIWMGLNHQPRVKDDSFGFWRRVQIIPFTRIFNGSKANSSLRTELAAEAPGILRWAVEGCLQWQENGLRPPVCVFSATDAYQQAEDPLNDFTLERLEPDPDHQTPAMGMYHAYREWAKDQGFSERETLTSTSFGRLISKRFEKKQTEHGKRYLGVRVKVRPRDLLSSIDS